MDTLGINASQEEVDLMIEEIDQDNNGEIDFDEFVAVMSRKVNANYTPSQVKNAFKIFESTASPPGYIKVEELKAALCQYSKDKCVPPHIAPENSSGELFFSRHIISAHA